MTSPGRRRLRYREAEEILERGHGVAYGTLALGRLIHILWYMTVGKRRFVPTGVDPKWVQKQKKRDRQNRRHGQRKKSR